MQTVHRNKTAYYSIVLPVRVALYLAGQCDERVHAQVEPICTQIGVWFQAQDDFLDCFGDPSVTGKIGRDIEEGKVTWLAVEALERADDRQRRVFIDNYGHDDEDSVERIKLLYKDELNLVQRYREYEDETYDTISAAIDELSHQTALPPQLFDYYLDKLYKRNK